MAKIVNGSKYVFWGLTANCNDVKDHYRDSVIVLRQFFGDNAELLKMHDTSVNEQLRRLKEEYGIKIQKSVLSELKNGKRFKTGWLLIMAIRSYWLKRGYEIKIG